jgi:hypothetical protein
LNFLFNHLGGADGLAVLQSVAVQKMIDQETAES